MIARSQPRSVALATARKVADLWAGDRLLLEELRRRGLRSEPIVWDDDAVDWRAWDVVLIRSCWDYHLQVERFCAWLDRLECEGVLVMNPPALVRWNIHKRYLLDVARNGVRVPPTRVASRDSGRSLAAEIDDAGWPATVIKPAISASGHGARLVRGRPTSQDEREYGALLAIGDVVLQAWVPEVRTRGEWSLVFFDRRYSHAVLKRAAPGEFRVQIEWGGSVHTQEPPRAIVADAQAVVDALDAGAVYARIDGTDVQGRLMIMEVELIEPELFLDRHPAAAGRLADVVTRGLSGSAAAS
jgi:glutathione synthase/RimK-type ligase-like ATP-grasp enzyme